MTDFKQPYRQIHLDFHTSPHATDIGINFNPEQFANTLAEAEVESINIFGKCHHGYTYYPTKVGTVHPHLKFDLLGQQIEALHKVGIRCTVYYTIVWDDLAGQLHPDWVIVNKNNTVASRSPLGNEWGWTCLDVSSGYYEYMEAQVAEIIDGYDADGMWFDICFPLPNYSTWGMEQMRDAGIDPHNDKSVWDFARRKQERFFGKMSDFVHSKMDNATVFFNGTMKPDVRRLTPYMTHFEVESLPTTGEWGYLHYPLTTRQMRTYDKDFLGMNGRFHKSWGDFGGLKTRDQLDYECGVIVGAGGKICVGDQLHPNGELDPAVYRTIGDTFKRIKQLEPYLSDSTPVTDLAILAIGEPHTSKPGIAAYSADVEGAAQVFLEVGIQFDIIDAEADFSDYPLLVIPDTDKIDDSLLAKINQYLANGGRLMVSGRAGKFDFIDNPVRYIETVPTIPSYLRPDTSQKTNSDIAHDYNYAFYEQAHIVQAQAGVSTYGNISRALFNRTSEHYMGHQHAPVGESLDTPIAIYNDKIIYFSAPLFAGHRVHDYWVYRDIALEVIERFGITRRIKSNAPGWVELSVHEQKKRQVIHAVKFQPRRTMQTIVHVDQSLGAIPISIELQCQNKPDNVKTMPDETPLDFDYADGSVSFELPLAQPHTVVVIE